MINCLLFFFLYFFIACLCNCFFEHFKSMPSYFQQETPKYCSKNNKLLRLPYIRYVYSYISSCTSTCSVTISYQSLSYYHCSALASVRRHGPGNGHGHGDEHWQVLEPMLLIQRQSEDADIATDTNQYSLFVVPEAKIVWDD